MFNNPGKVLKTLAIIQFSLITVSAVIFGIIFVIKTFSDSSLFILVAIACFLLGPLAAYITCMPLLAYGHLVEDQKELRENSEKMLKLLKHRLPERYPSEPTDGAYPPPQNDNNGYYQNPPQNGNGGY